MARRRLHGLVSTVALAAAIGALTGCPNTPGGDDDDDSTDVYTGPQEANLNYNVFGTVGGADYSLIVDFGGDEVGQCGPTEDGESVVFHLTSSDAALETEGQLLIRAAGFDTDTGTHPSQTLYADEPGAQFHVLIPEATNAPFAWVAGSCYLYVTTEEEVCKSPRVPYCGNFTCGHETPLENGSGDTVNFTGTFNCFE